MRRVHEGGPKSHTNDTDLRSKEYKHKKPEKHYCEYSAAIRRLTKYHKYRLKQKAKNREYPTRKALDTQTVAHKQLIQGQARARSTITDALRGCTQLGRPKDHPPTRGAFTYPTLTMKKIQRQKMPRPQQGGYSAAICRLKRYHLKRLAYCAHLVYCSHA